MLRDPEPDRVRRTPPGRPVVLVTDRPVGRRRLRRTARRAGVTVERELLVLPGTRHALVSVDEDPTAIRHLWDAVAAVPPGLTWATLPASALVIVAGRLPWRWSGALLGGHVLIGRRP